LQLLQQGSTGNDEFHLNTFFESGKYMVLALLCMALRRFVLSTFVWWRVANCGLGDCIGSNEAVCHLEGCTHGFIGTIEGEDVPCPQKKTLKRMGLSVFHVDQLGLSN
jgi:hypothetical protein